MKRGWKGIRPLIREYASRPEGCGLHDIPGLTSHQVVQNSGLMPEVIAVGYRSERRLFTDKAAAERYELIDLPRIKAEKADLKKQARRRAKPEAEPKPAPKPKKAAPGVHIPRYTGAKWDAWTPADYSKAIRTVASGHPGYDARYTLPPGTVVHGEFSRIPLGATLKEAA